MRWCAGGAEGMEEEFEEGDSGVEVDDVGKGVGTVGGRIVKWWEGYCSREGEEELLQQHIHVMKFSIFQS
jgi:hypothetical protein